jgi:hypothetical protein
MATQFVVMAEINAEQFFKDTEGGDSLDWSYCNEFATFKHKEACEFILHCFHDENYARNVIDQMRNYGCSEPFIDAFQKAADAGAIRVLFWA